MCEDWIFLAWPATTTYPLLFSLLRLLPLVLHDTMGGHSVPALNLYFEFIPAI